MTARIPLGQATCTPADKDVLDAVAFLTRQPIETVVFMAVGQYAAAWEDDPHVRQLLTLRRERAEQTRRETLAELDEAIAEDSGGGDAQ